jgi:hypothetical protein
MVNHGSEGTMLRHRMTSVSGTCFTRTWLEMCGVLMQLEGVHLITWTLVQNKALLSQIFCEILALTTISSCFSYHDLITSFRYYKVGLNTNPVIFHFHLNFGSTVYVTFFVNPLFFYTLVDVIKRFPRETKTCRKDFNGNTEQNRNT